jgi:TnpA family transposase
LNAIPLPGTMRDSLILLAVVLEQQTKLKPTRIMTDTGAYSDVMFGLFRHLGYRFCPRLADIGGSVSGASIREPTTASSMLFPSTS